MLVELFSSRAFLQCSYRVPDPMIETRIKHDCLLLEALQSNQAIHGRDYFEQLRQPRMNAAQYSVHEAWQPACLGSTMRTDCCPGWSCTVQQHFKFGMAQLHP